MTKKCHIFLTYDNTKKHISTHFILIVMKLGVRQYHCLQALLFPRRQGKRSSGKNCHCHIGGNRSANGDRIETLVLVQFPNALGFIL